MERENKKKKKKEQEWERINKNEIENSDIEQQMLNIVLIYSGPAVLMAM